jgi:acetyl-CoA C-acetyltransferase
VAAIASGRFVGEIVPIAVPGRSAAAAAEAPPRRGDTRIERDEGPRAETTAEKLSSLKPAFAPDGTVTPGNASQLSEGAAAVVVANEDLARRSRSPIKARIVAAATTGVAPKELFIAPVSAIERVLNKASMSLADIDLIELNEAFAAQCLACMRPLGLDPEKTNVHGGAIALGHPIGASGARVLVTLLYALARRGLRRGLAALCLGGGNAVAMIVEREG